MRKIFNVTVISALLLGAAPAFGQDKNDVPSLTQIYVDAADACVKLPKHMVNNHCLVAKNPGGIPAVGCFNKGKPGNAEIIATCEAEGKAAVVKFLEATMASKNKK